jgi:hypothetical protein
MGKHIKPILYTAIGALLAYVLADLYTAAKNKAGVVTPQPNTGTPDYGVPGAGSGMS